MKKLLSILLVAALLCLGSSVAYGARVDQSRIGLIRLQSTGLMAPHTHVRTSPGLIYRISYTASLARTWLAVLDSNTTGDANSVGAHLSNLITGNRVLVDLSIATAGASLTVEYDPPLEFKNGLMISTGTTSSVGLLIDLGENAAGTPLASAIIHYGE
ncbi:hypothetical protein LCGC14_1312880 [marine sediment metagenome]|uniref:Uncharacterized protein n=1 Tax=marine sediment metagenome TaxID=412755 RepID=A0A0F9KMB8_9ZZZZ